MSILEIGSLVGEDDCLSREKHTSSLVCYSEKGTLYRMDKATFLSLKSSENAWLNCLEKVSRNEFRSEGLDVNVGYKRANAKLDIQLKRDTRINSLVQNTKYSSFRDDCRLDNLRPVKIIKVAEEAH